MEKRGDKRRQDEQLVVESGVDEDVCALLVRINPLVLALPNVLEQLDGSLCTAVPELLISDDSSEQSVIAS